MTHFGLPGCPMNHSVVPGSKPGLVPPGTLLAHVAYNPGIPKVASSSIKAFFRDTEKKAHKETLATAPNNTLFRFTAVRDPLDRFLAAFFQWLRMSSMGWMDDVISGWKMQFWNTVCPNQTRTQRDNHGPGKYICSGQDPGAVSAPADIARELKPDMQLPWLEAFIADLEKVGFPEQHTLPQTFLLRDAEPPQDASTFLIDIKDVDAFLSSLSVHLFKLHRPMPIRRDTRFQRAFAALTRQDVLGDTRFHGLVARICSLYREDFMCLGYDFPEPCANSKG